MGMLATVLAFGTLGFVTVLGYLGARATEQLKDDPAHRPSTLCVKSPHWLSGQS
ncbi:hypothetical protein [uncultured Roseobacter sp.]|nr:hypothetical protein [uncultured Roseobacter sp.]